MRIFYAVPCVRSTKEDCVCVFSSKVTNLSIEVRPLQVYLEAGRKEQKEQTERAHSKDIINN